MAWTEAEYQAYLLRQGKAPDTPEATLVGQIRQVALANGFLYYHTYDSRKSDLGFVDIVCCKPWHPLYLWEVKSATGKLSEEQERWLQFLSQATGIVSGLIRPRDFPEVAALLTRRTP